jgi:hypothetical protein
MATNVWDEWLRGGEAPLAKMYNNPTAGYSPITGTNAPPLPAVYRPQVGNRTRDTGANGPGLGRIGTYTPDAWYKDIPQTAFNEFISEDNSDWFRREYAGSRGLGEQTEEALSRFSPLPQNWLSALGQDKKYSLSQPNAPQRQADLMTKLYDRLLGPRAGYIDPKRIMENIVKSVWNEKQPGKNDYMANMLSNPQLSPDAQVGNFWSFVNGTVGRLMPRGTMQAYQKIIDRESALYKDFMVKNPTMSMTFNRWIGQRLGPTGGL